jgi:hypothetical protein
VAVAAVFAVVALALASAQLRRVARVASRRDAELAVALKRTAVERRLDELARRSEPGGWAGQLAHELLELEAPEARVARVNEVLAELEHRLCEGSAWPAAALRIAVAGAFLSCVVAVAVGRLDASLAAVAVGAVGALGSLECGRRARLLASTQRTVVDAVVEAASPALLMGMTGDSTRVRRRHRARSASGGL